MKKLLFLVCALPMLGTAQVFTKINASVTGHTQGVNSPLQTIKTHDGHIWFNSLVASRYRLYEYDGSSYIYHDKFYDSTVAGLRDISATYYAQAKDGTIYTQGQYYKNGVWRKTPFQQECFAQSQDGATLYFNRNNDSLFSLTNGVMTGYNVALNQIPGIATPFSGASFRDAVADNQGNLYFATQDTGVVKVNVASGTVTYMPIFIQGQFAADARALHLASNGHLYVGSQGDYMAYHDGTNWTVLTNMQPWDFGMGRIDDFAEDSQGRVWVGSVTSSLYGFLGRFDESDTTRLFDVIWDTTANHEYISNRNIEAILIENDTTFYFGVYQENYLLRVGASNIVSLKEQHLPKSLAAYPNPVIATLHLTGIMEGQAQVYALTGKLMAVKQVEQGTLNLETLPPGAYVLKVVDKEFRPYQMKFIKE